MSSILLITRLFLSKKKVIVPLVLILVASSAAFAVSLSILLSTQQVGSSVLGEQGGIVIISSGNSRTPLTSTLPLSVVNSLGSIRGISAYSPEVLAPSMASGKLVVVVGVYPSLFDRLESGSLTILSGSGTIGNYTNTALVGDSIASTLGLKVGSHLLLSGVLNSADAEVVVGGVFHTGTTLDDEIVAPVWVGQWLRGFDYQVVSIVRLRLDSGQSQSAIEQTILNSLGKQNSTSSSPLGSFYSTFANTPLTPSQLASLNIQVNAGTSSDFLSRTLGLSQESIWIISALVFLSVSIAVIFAFQEAVLNSRGDLITFSMIGMSRNRIRIGMIISSLIFALISGLVGWAVAIGIFAFDPALSSLPLVFYSLKPTSFALIALIGTITLVAIEAVFASIYSSPMLQDRRSQEDPVLYDSTQRNIS